MSTSTAIANLTIRVNDEPRRLAGATTLDALVRDLGLTDRKGVAIAVNNSVVPRAAWSTRALADGDHVLVIQATQGG
jgi:sulfur carrier protein